MESISYAITVHMCVLISLPSHIRVQVYAIEGVDSVTAESLANAINGLTAEQREELANAGFVIGVSEWCVLCD